MFERYPNLYADISAVSFPGKIRCVKQVLTNGMVDRIIHGSDFPGSIGCIDLTSHMDAFLQVLGNTVPDRNGMIPLKVSYGVAPTGKEPNEIDMKGHDISRTA